MPNPFDINAIGDELWFVSIVYIGILLPWGFLYFHDFISVRWQTIRSTFRAGIIHVIVISVPMPLIVAYIVFQQTLENKDNKETYAAITALAVGLFHLLRTLWGINQLVVFRRWAIETAVALERASYHCVRLSPPSYTPPVQGRRTSSFSAFQRPSTLRPPTSVILRPSATVPSDVTTDRGLPRYSRTINRRARRPNGLLYSIFYPFCSVAKRLGFVTTGRAYPAVSSVQPPFDLPQGNPRDFAAQQGFEYGLDSFLNGARDPDNANNNYPPHACTETDIISEERRLDIEEQVNNMKVNSSIIDNEFIGSEAPRTRLFTTTFIDPHDAFVRWSICYLAQFGAVWLKASKTRPFGKSTWDGRRYSLAVDVWATACLRMETTSFKTDSSLDKPNESGMPTDNASQVSFLAPVLWNKILLDHHDHVFSKDNLLRDCLRSGHGMPYGRPIISEREQLPAPGEYKGLIKDILGDLPAKFYDVVDGITPEQLHWFAIFICIADWSGSALEDRSNTSLDGSPRTPNLLDPYLGPIDGVLHPDHAPVRTLQDQLGIDDDLTLDRCPFPFVRQRYGRYLWGNRSVLQVSARIDNWLALRIGRQIEKLSRSYHTFASKAEEIQKAHMSPYTESIVDTKNDGEPGNTEDKGGSNNSDSTPSDKSDMKNKKDRWKRKRGEDIFHCHRRLEIYRLKYQLARLDVPLHHYDQGITFMGCAMETVRSFLAEDVYVHKDNDNGATTDWEPIIDTNQSETFPISQQLVDCMHAVEAGGSHRFDSTVQERLLWECQNGLVRKLDFALPRDKNIRAKTRPDLMMLAILSFPGLFFEHVSPNSSTPAEDLNLSKSQQSVNEDERISNMERGDGNFNNGSTNVISNSTADSVATGDTKARPSVKDTYYFDLSFSIEAPVAPQLIKVCMDVSVKSQLVNLHLSCGENVTRFQWQDWRDAFLGRLSGKAEWQRSHFMRNLLVNPTDSPINSLFKDIPVGQNRAIPLWQGWQPFRARIRRFELEHSSLIIVNEVMPVDYPFSPGDSWDDRPELNGVLAEGVNEGDTPRPRFSRFKKDEEEKNQRLIDSFPHESVEESGGAITESVVGSSTADGSTTAAIGNAELFNKSVDGVRMTLKRIDGATVGPSSRLGGIDEEGDIVKVTPDTLHRVETKIETRQGFGMNPYESPYFEARPDALSDASTHVDSVLRLNSTLLDAKGKGLQNEEPRSTGSRRFGLSSPSATSGDYFMDYDASSPRHSPLWSDPHLPVPGVPSIESDGINESINKELIKKVNEQDADAMAELANYLLTGTRSFRQDRTRALGLLERAVAIDKNLKTAHTYIVQLLGDVDAASATQGSITKTHEPSNVRRAIAMVELLWRDMPTRFEVVLEDEGTRKGGRKRKLAVKPGHNPVEEEKRVRQLVDLHKRVIYARRSADVMTSLGDQLARYGTSTRQNVEAVIMYESAIIAGSDPFAMVGLALIHVDRDHMYAKRLFDRAMHESFNSNGEWANTLASMKVPIANAGMSMAISDGRSKDLREMLRDYSTHGDRRASKLLASHGY